MKIVKVDILLVFSFSLLSQEIKKTFENLQSEKFHFKQFVMILSLKFLPVNFLLNDELMT